MNCWEILEVPRIPWVDNTTPDGLTSLITDNLTVRFLALVGRISVALSTLLKNMTCHAPFNYLLGRFQRNWRRGRRSDIKGRAFWEAVRPART